MKWIYIGLGAAVLLFFIWKKKGTALTPATKQTAAVTTNTATKPDPFWTGWKPFTDFAIGAATNYVNATEAQKSSIQGVSDSLFGGASKSTGAASPQTSGGGAGVPSGTGPYASPNLVLSSTTEEPIDYTGFGNYALDL